MKGGALAGSFVGSFGSELKQPPMVMNPYGCVELEFPPRNRWLVRAQNSWEGGGGDLRIGESGSAESPTELVDQVGIPTEI